MYTSYSSPTKNYSSESNSTYYHKVVKDSDPLKSSEYSSSSKYAFGTPSSRLANFKDFPDFSKDFPDIPKDFSDIRRDFPDISKDFSSDSLNTSRRYESSYTSKYDKINDYDEIYDKSDKIYEKYDKQYDKSYDYKLSDKYDRTESDDNVRQHSNSYFIKTDRSYINPEDRKYGSPPNTSNRRVHYEFDSSGEMNTSGRSGSHSPYERAYSPDDQNPCPLHPYRSQKSTIIDTSRRSGSHSPYEQTFSPSDEHSCPLHPYRSQTPLILHESVGAPFRHLHGPNSSYRSSIGNTSADFDGRKPQFVAVTRLEDAQAIRAAEFHPNGQLYAIGSNSKTLRICGYPKSYELKSLRDDHIPHQPTVLSKRLKHHKGSIYCLAWNTTGDLLATGSNDKTIKMMRFNSISNELEGGEAELTMHDGTIRDMCFMEDLSNRSSLLISGGAGDCKIYVTDCDTMTPFQALSGHSGHILSLYTWGGAMFVSGSQDRTIRFWDLRTRGCVNLITAPPASGKGAGSAVAAVCVDPSGKLLVSGHEDSNCMLYDIRGGRIIQTFQPHSSDIRTIRFSNKAYYLLTGGYDNKVVLTDLQGDLTQPLPSIVVAEHSDKVIQGRWHPYDFTFLTTSADKSATLWALPN